jgi:hypothetical protein
MLPFHLLPFRFRQWWYDLRHEVFYAEAVVYTEAVTQPPNPDSDSDSDNPGNPDADWVTIQRVIDTVHTTPPPAYLNALQRYDTGPRFLLPLLPFLLPVLHLFRRRPVLRHNVQLRSGTYHITRPIVLPDSVRLVGEPTPLTPPPKDEP